MFVYIYMSDLGIKKIRENFLTYTSQLIEKVTNNFFLNGTNKKFQSNPLFIHNLSSEFK